jgi:hypothetical protein
MVIMMTVGFERSTRRATFLTEMERVEPRSALCGLCEAMAVQRSGWSGRAHLFFAAMVQLVGRSALRFAGDARFLSPRTISISRSVEMSGSAAS